MLFWREFVHFLNVEGKNPNILEKVFFFFNIFYSESNKYTISYGTVGTGILDMRSGKHDLHFLMGVELLLHVFVNISDEKMHIGVFYLFLLFTLYLYLFFYLFVVFQLGEIKCNSY
jgi:hypothetical protein